MECKLSLGKVAKNLSKELIETLWNVNTSAAEEPSGDAQELIETLWNVNNLFNRIAYEVLRINRNIVECKFNW